MYTYNASPPIKVQNLLPSPESINSSDSEDEVAIELEQKRRQIQNEIAAFQAQKEEEFRRFERELRANRRWNRRDGWSIKEEKARHEDDFGKAPSRTSSSSALDLLVGHGAVGASQVNRVSKKKSVEKPFQCKTCSKTGPLPSKPVVSLDKMNIRGETIPNSTRPRTPPAPTLLSKRLTRSSPTTSLAASPPRRKSKSPPLQDAIIIPQDDQRGQQVVNLFTPSYLSLLESNVDISYSSSSVLITPPVEDETATAPCSFKSSMTDEVFPLSSSSFPPQVKFSPSSHTHPSKRSYTAPTVPSGRKPSALRTASGGTLSRKPKHVTFRLADSAIVQPSSSYEEGSSPDLEDDKGKQKRSSSGTRSPLGPGKSSLSNSASSDVEDAEAGVTPGMGMGEVMQKLNAHTVAEAANAGEELQLEVDDDYDEVEEDDDNEDDDLASDDGGSFQQQTSAAFSGARTDEQDHVETKYDVKYHEHEDSPESEEGYFSPRNRHVSAMDLIPRPSPPMVSYRNGSWSQVSLSDKDELVFKTRRHSDELEEDQNSARKSAAPSKKQQRTGFTGGVHHSIDGGSGVGFFELDEELASPDAGKVRPFDFDTDLDIPEDTDVGGTDETIMKSFSEMKADQERRRQNEGNASKFGVGSVPIDIVRPSLSVSSSWVGTFGH